MNRGSAPIELALGVGLLVVPMVLVLALVPPLVEHRAVARLAAAEAARVVVLGDGSATTEARARAVARAVAPDLELAVELCPSTGGVCGRLTRGGVVEVRVEVVVPVVEVGPFGELGGLRVGASHREQVDAYRSLP